MKKYFFVFLLSFVIFSACKKDDHSVEKMDDSKLKIASVNYPLHYFAWRIGGDQVEAIFPVPTDVDPAYWQPNSGDFLSVMNQNLSNLKAAL